MFQFDAIFLSAFLKYSTVSSKRRSSKTNNFTLFTIQFGCVIRKHFFLRSWATKMRVLTVLKKDKGKKCFLEVSNFGV